MLSLCIIYVRRNLPESPRWQIMHGRGYLIGAGAMILGGVAAIVFGVAAEGKSLEDIAAPLSMVRKAASSVSGSAPSPPPLTGHA